MIVIGVGMRHEKAPACSLRRRVVYRRAPRLQCNITAHECGGYSCAFDYSTGVTVEDIRIDSCKVKTLISKYGVVKDAAGLAGLLGARFWPVGVTAGVVFGWAWNNQSQLIGCSRSGKGIRLRQWAGIITGCYSQ